MALITEPCEVWAFHTVYSLTVMYPLLQKPHNKGPIVKVSDSRAKRLAICRHSILLGIGMAASKITHKPLTTSLLSFWSTHLSEAMWSLSIVVPRQESSLSHFSSNDQDKRGGYIALF